MPTGSVTPAAGGSVTGVPILRGPVALNVGAAPQTQTLWTFVTGDIILDLWLEITAVMDSLAAYEVYTAETDFIFPQSNLNSVNQDTTRWVPLLHCGVVASITDNNSVGSGVVTVPSRMRTTSAVTCDKTAGAAGGAGVAYALVIPA